MSSVNGLGNPRGLAKKPTDPLNADAATKYKGAATIKAYNVRMPPPSVLLNVRLKGKVHLLYD
ncbi:hypothetical protein D3C73_1373290 [compost metagenome]